LLFSIEACNKRYHVLCSHQELFCRKAKPHVYSSDVKRATVKPLDRKS